MIYDLPSALGLRARAQAHSSSTMSVMAATAVKNEWDIKKEISQVSTNHFFQ